MKKIVISIMSVIASLSCQSADNLTMIVGTYTGGGSKGIYSFRFDQTTGAATPLSEAEAVNPSYVAIDKEGKYIYSVSETEKNGTGGVDAFSLNKKTGEMKHISHSQSLGGSPCYISVSGKDVLVANYGGGSISAFKILKNGGLNPKGTKLDFNKEGQKAARLHCTVFSPDEKSFFACNLGHDCIYKSKIGSDGEIELENTYKLSVGDGPRHIVFSPNSKYAYMICELSGLVYSFSYDGKDLKAIQSIQADTLNAHGSADIRISPDGKYLYASNRLKGDGVAIFAINTDGKLTKVGYQNTGIHPRNFAITPNGKYLLVACRDSNVIQVYERDKITGLLKDINKDIKLSSPVCIQFVK